MAGIHLPKYSRSEFLRFSVSGLGTLLAFSPTRMSGLEQNTQHEESTAKLSDSSFKLDLREFVQWIVRDFEPAARLPGGAGRYAERPGLSKPDLYGVADMACVLYTIGKLHPTAAERDQWRDAFEIFQTYKDGWFVDPESGLSPQHNTAFALAAMQLLDLRPKTPVTAGQEYRDIKSYLNTINWNTNVYRGSHNGAGIGSIFALVPELHSVEWFQEYFATCDSLFDSHNGLMGRNKPMEGDTDQIGGTFHYNFLYEFFNRQMPYPEQRIDTVLRLQRPDGYWLKGNPLWMTLDAIYLMTRTLRYCPHRFSDVQKSVRKILDTLSRDVFSPEGRKATFYKGQGVHALTAAMSIAAEAQQFLGSREVITEWPLKLVLDRRPFI